MNEEEKTIDKIVVEYLKTLPQPLLHIIIYELMVDGVINYHELMDMHIQNLERLKKGETEAYFRLQAKVIDIWCDKKKNVFKNIQACMQHLYDEGRINTTQQKIDNYWKGE